MTDPDELGPVIHEATHHGTHFMFRVKVFSGEEGQALAIKQARAIRELLLWVRQTRLAREADHARNANAKERALQSHEPGVSGDEE